MKITIEFDASELSAAKLIAIAAETLKPVIKEPTPPPKTYHEQLKKPCIPLMRNPPPPPKEKAVRHTLKKVVTTKEKKCPKCDNNFKPKGNRQKYCSEACGMKPKEYVKKANSVAEIVEEVLTRPQPKELTPEQLERAQSKPYSDLR